jgi:hypothetical protein
MKYKLLKYISDDPFRGDTYLCEDENGSRLYIDLFRNGSHRGFGNLRGDIEAKRKSFVGRVVEIEELLPFTPLMFAKDITLLSNENDK